jgi:hypothetical protein
MTLGNDANVNAPGALRQAIACLAETVARRAAAPR